jgi:CheY-like chemotaxis protein
VPHRVLVVEDDPAIQAVVAHFLCEEGFDVAVASNGAHALHLAHQTPPDIAVVDVFMPVMDGRALLAIWMHEPTLQSVPVVLVSAAPGLSDLARQYNVRATLAKPFDLDRLGEIVEQVLAPIDSPE